MLTHTILTEIDWQYAREGHTVDSLLRVLVDMLLVAPEDSLACSVNVPICGNIGVRHQTTYSKALIRVCKMLASHELEIDGKGKLYINEDPEAVLELFQGDYYVTQGRNITGPVKLTEARKCLSNSRR